MIPTIAGIIKTSFDSIPLTNFLETQVIWVRSKSSAASIKFHHDSVTKVVFQNVETDW